MQSRLTALTLALLLAATTLAHADPVSGLIVTALAVPAALAPLATSLITLALTLGTSLLLRALFTPEIKVPGVQLDVEVGDDSPIGFVVGSYATAGTRKYIGVYGESGDDVPNKYLVDVLQVGDITAPGQPGLWVNGERCTILWDEEDGQGFPIENFRDGDDDKLWIKYYDGSQTTASTYLRDNFGDDDDRPWKSTMIGRGCPFVVITAQFDREEFPGQMRYVIEAPSIPLYDIRKDDTEGGDGDHRWGDASTYEASDNPAVIIYNIIRGIYYGSEWVYGGQNLPSFRLPAANWMAAMNECDRLIDLDGGGQEKQFRAGYEIRGDQEPLEIIEELLKGCNGRLSEAGGIFKIAVGAPGAAVYSFTDSDIIITKEQSYQPFPGLDATHNAIEATYPEPEEMWSQKDAPALYDDDLEEEDGDRRLVVSIDFPTVPFGVQVQRLVKAAANDSRRFRQHSFYLPPAAWLLEPNDVVSWTSARNGYVAKKFQISQLVGEPSLNQLVGLREVDPADYDWDPETDQQATTTGFMGPIRTPPQAMVGWQVDPATLKDSLGVDRRPTIQVTFAGNLVDVRAVQIQVRLASDGTMVFDGEAPYGDPDAATKEVVLNATFLPDEEYEARGRFLPYSNRLTEWSSWLAVTTPDVKITDVSVLLDGLSDDVRDVIQLAHQRLDDAAGRIEELALSVIEQAGVFTERTALAVRALNGTAGVIRETQASVLEVDGRVTAQAEILDAVQAAVGDASAGILWQMRASAVDDGDITAEVNLDLRAEAGGEFAFTGMQWRVGFVGGDPTRPYSEIRAIASRFLFIDDDGGNPVVPAALVDGTWYLRNLKVQTAEIDDLAVRSAKIPFNELQAISRPITNLDYTATNPTSDNVITTRVLDTFSINNEGGSPVEITVAGNMTCLQSGSGVVGGGINVRNSTTGLYPELRGFFPSGTSEDLNRWVEQVVFDEQPARGVNTYELVMSVYEGGSTGTISFTFTSVYVTLQWGVR